MTTIGPFRWKREAADIKSKHPDVAGPSPRKTIIPECDQSAERARRVDVGNACMKARPVAGGI